MKRKSILIWILVAAVVGLGAVWFSYHRPSFKRATKTTNTNSVVTNMNVSLPTSITYKGEDGKNALDLLKAKHEVVETDGFVKAIDKRPNSTTSYWMLYVNGRQAEKGAKDTVTASSDTIEWRFEGAK